VCCFCCRLFVFLVFALLLSVVSSRLRSLLVSQPAVETDLSNRLSILSLDPNDADDDDEGEDWYNTEPPERGIGLRRVASLYEGSIPKVENKSRSLSFDLSSATTDVDDADDNKAEDGDKAPPPVVVAVVFIAGIVVAVVVIGGGDDVSVVAATDDAGADDVLEEVEVGSTTTES